MSDLEGFVREDWAAFFDAAVKESGLTRAEFARQAGFTRNIAYGLSRGRKPRPEQLARIEIVRKNAMRS